MAQGRPDESFRRRRGRIHPRHDVVFHRVLLAG